MTGVAARRVSAPAAILAAALAAAPLSAQQITAATYDTPTTRYDHGVLGDDEEWANMQVTVRSERGERGSLFFGFRELTYNMTLPEEMVYEDIAPRLADVDGDGAPEIVVVESHRDHGARLAIYGLKDGRPAYLAGTPFIGQPRRWLAPVGVADLDGDGAVEVAFVLTPHLGKQLQVWRFAEGKLSQVAHLGPVTNHRIGDDWISGGIRDCGQGPEMVVLSADWSQIMAVRLTAQDISGRVLGPNTGRESVARVLRCG